MIEEFLSKTENPTDLFRDLFGFEQKAIFAETFPTKEQLRRSTLSDFLETLS